MELEKQLKSRSEMQKEENEEHTSDFSEEESRIDEEPMTSVEHEMDSDSHGGPDLDENNDEAMSINAVNAPSFSEKIKKTKLQKKQDVNSKRFRQLFQAISDMF